MLGGDSAISRWQEGPQRFSACLITDFSKLHFLIPKVLRTYVRTFTVRHTALFERGVRSGFWLQTPLAQADTREVGLDVIVSSGGSIYCAEPLVIWPGTANVHVSLVHWRRGGWGGSCELAERICDQISARLEPAVANQTEATPVSVLSQIARQAVWVFKGWVLYRAGDDE